MSKTYQFVPYDKTWPQAFDQLKIMLGNIFGDKATQIEHVGSTAIPGMDAKPLIDVLVIVKNTKDLAKEKESLVSLGYVVRENIREENSFLFEKIINDQKVENIHVCEENTKTVDEFLYVRDYLRAHPERVQEYIELKYALKKEFPDDYLAYRKGKNDFLKETEQLGREMKR